MFRKSMASVAIAVMSFTGHATVSALPAGASTYTNSYNGTDAVAFSTTLNYSNNHAAFNIRIRVTRSKCCWSTAYGISMSNSLGVVVWSATNQQDRTYYIGGNVTKIVISPNDKTGIAFLTTRWDRQ